MLKNISNFGKVLNKKEQKRIIGGNGQEVFPGNEEWREFLDCTLLRIEVTGNGGFIYHERCCSKGPTGGTCFNVSYNPF